MPDDLFENYKVKLAAWCAAIAAVGVIFLLVNNQTSSMQTSDTTAASTPVPVSAPSASSAKTSTASSFKNGTYSASGSYRTPQSIETINVTLTIRDNSVADVSIAQQPQNHDAVVYQSAFRQGYKPFVVGKKLTDLHLSRVSGSSLTPIGFDEALDSIKAQASQG